MAKQIKLNQAIALVKDSKSRGESALTKVYHGIQNKALLAGVVKTYKPRDEEGEKLPSEGTRLQVRVPSVLASAVGPLSRMFDLTATVDAGNQIASADIVVDGVVVLKAVPVTTILFLEKKFVDLATVVAKLPTLDEAEEWEEGDDGLSFKTVPSSKVRTKKVPRVLEKSPATDKHPAQVEVWHEDIVVGDWTTITFSGAISQKRQRELAKQVAKFQEALKIAREQANSELVTEREIGAEIFKFLGWATA